MLLLGIIIAIIFVLIGIGGGKAGLGAILLFLSPPAALIVFGSALALILAAHGGKGLGLVFKAPFARNMIKEDIKRSINVYKDLKLYLILWGFVCMIIGFVLMLAHMDDPDDLGPGLALAILCVLYGLLAAYLICHPIQKKLEQSDVD